MIKAEGTLYPEIPLNAGQIQGWKDIPIQGADQLEPLIPLGLLSQETAFIATSSIYFGEHSNSPYAKKTNKLEGSLLTLFVRRSTARRLLTAEQLLPEGYHLLVFDAYRPYQVQKSLYDFYKQKLREKHPDMSDQGLDIETQNYVSLPSQNPSQPSPHSTGGVVDVAIVKLDLAHEKELLQIRSHFTDGRLDLARRVGLEMRQAAIIRRHGKMLNFGTAFDHGGEKSGLAYYESKVAAGGILKDDDAAACNNRRLLFKVMTQAGFQSYFAEWWHFDAPETQWGAAAAGLSYATFGAADLDEHNLAHESTRLAIREIGRLKAGRDWPVEVIAPPKL